MEKIDLPICLTDVEIPTSKERIGFLEIIKKSHNETINSNIYAYFLSGEDSTISHAFLAALLSLIKEKTGKKYAFSKHEVTTELVTETGRIDIVIRDLLSPTTLLIENKLLHWLHNPLLAYWNHFKIAETHKLGILLTIDAHEIPQAVYGKFINITHWEWVSTVKKHVDLDSLKDPANKVYLNDFFNTIEKLSTTYKMNASAKFFFENASQVNKAHKTLLEGHKFILGQYDLIASKLGLQTYGGDINWKNFWDEDNVIDTYFTITAHDIISGEELKYQIIIELIREDKLHLDSIVNEFKEHPQFKVKERGQNKDFYCHLIVKEYCISLSELASLADHVVENIRKDFGELFIAIVKFRYSEKNISKWRQKVLPQ